MSTRSSSRIQEKQPMESIKNEENRVNSSRLFENLSFLVHSSCGQKAKVEELVETIEEIGGTVKKRMDKSVDYLVCKNPKPAKNTFNAVLIHPDFIWESQNQGEVADPSQFPVVYDDTVDIDEKKETKKLKLDDTTVTEKIEGENIVKEVRKGRAVVDRHCPIVTGSHVFQEGRIVWDAMLNQTNIGQNNNKFYMLQLLGNDNFSSYYVWRRWGRVGVHGQSELQEFGQNVSDAKAAFSKKFREKTGNQWGDFESFQHIPGRYDVLQRDYGEDFTDDVAIEEVPSKLDNRVQDLMKMIFDTSMITHSIAEIGYDANKMPLGKLTKNHILRGYEILKNIGDILEVSRPSTKELSDLTSRFYTLIPHDFGRNRPPIIDTPQMLKQKLALIDSLSEIQVATSIMKSMGTESICKLDTYYSMLKNDISPLQRGGDTWKIIETYANNTHAPTHSSYTLDIIEIFEVNRHGESDKFKRMDNRMLLWHGSRLMNFVGILTRGLQIAPPEAPITGYMFGKGVYFADMISKSANYCNTSLTYPEGLLLLCEVAVGETADLLQSDYNADRTCKKMSKHSTKGCGSTIPDENEFVKIEDGIIVPCGKPKSSGLDGSLLYNEYVVYDTCQIRMRYLVKTKFKWNQ